MITISEHTIEEAILTNGVCIDVGCRGFEFSRALAKFGCQVIAFDLEDLGEVPKGVEFYACAVSRTTGSAHYVDTADLQAKYLSNEGKPVKVIAMNDVFSRISDEIDVLKLDCEGSEYFILSDPYFQPRPRQITIEFHMHAHPQLHEEFYGRCMINLLRHYVPIQHQMHEAHGAGNNYWDSLFVRKDLVNEFKNIYRDIEKFSRSVGNYK